MRSKGTNLWGVNLEYVVFHDIVWTVCEGSEEVLGRKVVREPNRAGDDELRAAVHWAAQAMVQGVVAREWWCV